ncbi:MAG: T9SS type A sorting domain-containing protein, partial [Candidatus Sifarchaeia archaeon]
FDPVGIRETFATTKHYELLQNYPNPFNPVTRIKYRITEAGIVSLHVYNLLGEVVATLVNEEKPVGNYEVEFDAASLSSGIYFYKLQAGTFIQTKKMILMK